MAARKKQHKSNSHSISHLPSACIGANPLFGRHYYCCEHLFANVVGLAGRCTSNINLKSNHVHMLAGKYHMDFPFSVRSLQQRQTLQLVNIYFCCVDRGRQTHTYTHTPKFLVEDWDDHHIEFRLKCTEGETTYLHKLVASAIFHRFCRSVGIHQTFVYSIWAEENVDFQCIAPKADASKELCHHSSCSSWAGELYEIYRKHVQCLVFTRLHFYACSSSIQCARSHFTRTKINETLLLFDL